MAEGGSNRASQNRRRSSDNVGAAQAQAINTSNSNLNVRRQASKKKQAVIPQVTMQSSPTDLALLAENQLFQAYQVVYYNEQSSNSAASSQSSNANGEG